MPDRYSIPFVPFETPTGGTAWIPADVELKVPPDDSLSPADRHFLIYIPWHDRYLASIDAEYLDFFELVLPYLHVRTTDVHVASCLPFLREVAHNNGEVVDLRVAEVAFMLHDSGWSQMSALEIAHSLGVQGLSLSGEAVNPKARHAVLGQQVARKLIEAYPFQPPLSEAQKQTIYQAILYHDKPWELAADGQIPPTVKLVCDVDHQWSFTHPNFWQDTVRKGIRADEYLDNLGKDLESYFVTPAGKEKARQQLERRQAEVRAWNKNLPRGNHS